ncbi:MAG: hypothetical protein R3F56_06150 [Planctomycetota bacterium]
MEVRRSERRGLAWLLLAAMCFFGLFAHGYVENGDAEMTMHAARAWWRTGDPGLQQEGPTTTLAERTIAGWIHTPGPPDFGMVGTNGRAYVWFPIGHQALMVPCVAAGESLARAFPAPEAELRRLKGEAFGELFWSRFLCSLLPIPFAAGTVVLVFLLARSLGLSSREALRVTLAATLCTAFWPGSSETMSDTPGTFFLLGAVVAVFVFHAAAGRGEGAVVPMLLGGASAGAAVLVRYPHAASVMVLTAGAAWVAWRAGRWRELLAFAVAGLPFAVALLAANWLRFASLTETGYSAGATKEWFSYPPWLGGALILAAPGKGILWFSPVLWPALAQLLRRATWRCAWPVLVALGCAGVPIAISAHTAGWAAGQCWSVRYVTPGVVLLVTVLLAVGRPWRRRPRLFAAACALGALVSLGGVLTPYRGDRNLAYHATRAAYPDRSEGELPMIWDFEPRFSPIKSHWIYAWLSLTGRLEVGGSANTTEPLFGVRVDDGAKPLRPSQVEDRGFRHWWWRYGAGLFGWPRWPAAVLALGAALAAALAWRRLGGRKGGAPLHSGRQAADITGGS